MIFRRFDIDYISDDLLLKTDSCYDNLLWNIEPNETLKELCKQRALQIRNTYDYIILYFSGGSDSTTVLNAFLDNNIFIDEIVICKFDGVDFTCLNGQKAENDLRVKGFRGKYTEVIITYDKVLDLLKDDNKIISTPNWTGQLHGIARFPIEYLEKFAFTNIFRRKGKICNLTGEQEPFVVKKDNTFYAKMLMKRKFIQSNHELMIPFFTTPDFPQLHIKQCHIVARYMKANPNIKITEKIKKTLVRDFYSELLSPIKCRDNPKFILHNINTYSEPTLILKQYMKHDSNFKDLYIGSIFRELFKITKKITEKSEKYNRYYKLFDSY